MKAEDVLKIVLREMVAYGYAWRNDWSDFDGRWLRNQLDGIEEWAANALASKEDSDYTDGTDFYKE